LPRKINTNQDRFQSLVIIHFLISNPPGIQFSVGSRQKSGGSACIPRDRSKS
jgi:hypothetical protein